MVEVLPILNNYVCDPKRDYYKVMDTIRTHAKSYGVRLDLFKMDMDSIACFIESHKGDADFKKTVAELLVRFAEALIRSKDFKEAYEIITALEGLKGSIPEDSQVEGYARSLGINAVYLETICAKSVDSSDDWFDFPYGKFLSLKADALKGQKKYSEAIPQYKKALDYVSHYLIRKDLKNTAGKGSDFAPYAKVSLLEAEVASGNVAAENLQVKTEEAKQLVNSSSIKPSEKQALIKRIDRLGLVSKKDFVALDKDYDAQLASGTLSKEEELQVREQKAWNLLNWAKDIAFDNPKAKDPNLKCTEKTCPTAEAKLKECEDMIDKFSGSVRNEYYASVKDAKIIFLLKWADQLKGKNINLALEKAKTADALIDRKDLNRDNLKKIAWLAWTYAALAKAGKRDALEKVKTIVADVGADKIDQNSEADKYGKKGKIRAAIADAMLDLAGKNISKLNDAIEYCKDKKFGGLYIKGLWQRIKINEKNGKDIDSVIDDLKTLAAIYSSESGRPLPPELNIQAAPKLTFDEKIQFYTIGIVLDKISSLLKKMDKKDEAKSFHDAAIEENKFYQPQIEKETIAKPTFKNFADLAQIYIAIGRSYLNSEDNNADNKINGEKYLNWAGYIYNKLLEINDFSFATDGLDAKTKAAIDSLRDSISITSDDKHPNTLSNYALIALELKLRAIEVSDDNAKKVEGNCETISRTLVRAIKNEKKIPEAEQNSELIAALENGQVEVARIKATALIRLGRSNEVIDLLKDNIITSVDRKNYEEVLGNTTILAWAYENLATMEKNPKYIQYSIALYKALSEGVDPKIKELEPIISLLIKKENFDSIKSKRPAEFELDINQKLARAYKNLATFDPKFIDYLLLGTAKELYQSILKDLKPGSKDLINAKLELASIAAYRTNFAVDGKDYKTAAKEIPSDEELKVIESLTTDFNSYRTLAWLYSLKGKIEERVSGTNHGKEYFIKAVGILETKILTADPALLTKIDLTKPEILLTIANLRQAIASDGDKEALEAAKTAYSAVLTSVASLTDKKSNNIRIEATFGLAEILLSGSKASLKANLVTEAEKSTSEAIEILKKVFVNIKDSDDINKMHFVNDLLWALSMTAAASKKKNIVSPEKSVLPILLRSLIKGDDFKNKNAIWTGIYAKAEKLSSFKLDEMIEFIIKNRSGLIKSETLEKTGTNILGLKASYINALIEIEQKDEAFKEFNLIESSLKDKDDFEPYEQMSIASLYSSLGDTLGYKMGLYDKAIEYYTKALDFISENDEDPTEIKALKTQAYSGRAYALEKKGDQDGALKDLKDIFELNGTNKDKISTDYNTEISRIKIDPEDPSLINALLTAANIYNYGAKDSAKALAFYKVAGLLARQLKDKYLRRRLMAKACHGVAETYRTIDKNFENAKRFYELGIELLKKSDKSTNDEKDENYETEESRNDSKKVLAQIYSGLAANYAIQLQFEKANNKMVEANETFKEIPVDEQDKELIRLANSLEETTRNIKRRQIDKLTTVQFGMMFVSDDYRSGSTHSNKTGWTPFVRSIINITDSFDLRLNYSEGLGKEFPRIPADKKEQQPGLNVNRQHTVSADVDWHPDYSVLKKIRVGAESTTATYNIAENPGQYNGSINNAAFQSLTLRAEGEFSFTPKTAPWLTLSFQPRIALLADSTTSPLIKNAEQLQREYPKAKIETGREPNGSERVSATGDLAANIDIPRIFDKSHFDVFDRPLTLSTRLGIGGGYDPLRYFGNGFWPVMGGEPLRSLYPFMNFRSEYEFGRHSLLFEFYVQRTLPGLSSRDFRSELYGNGRLGYRYYFENGQSIDANLEGSFFSARRPEKQEKIDNWSLGPSATWRF